MEPQALPRRFSIVGWPSFQNRASNVTYVSETSNDAAPRSPSVQEEKNEDNTDIILKTQGNVGCWQTLIVFIMSLFNMPAVFQVASPEVTAGEHISCCARPTHLHNISVREWREISGTWTLNVRGEKVFDACYKRDLPENATYYELLNYKTTFKTTCTTWDYDPAKTSIISQFNLACTSMPINNVAESLFLIGAAFGDIVNGLLSDRYGRRKVLMISQGFVVLTGFIIGNAPSYRMYLICRIVLGYLCSAVMLCSFIICIEILGGKWRGILTTAYMYSYSFGYISLHLFSEVLTNWIHLQYSITLIAVFLLSIWWLVPESPRWLLTMKNLPKLMITLETASSFNRLPLLPGIPGQIKNSKPMKTKQVKKVTLPMLFQTRLIRWMSIIGPFPCFFCSMTYYGLVLNNTLYSTTLFYSGLSEFCAVTFVLMLNLEKDIRLAAITISLSGICCLIGSALTTVVRYPLYGFLFDVVSLFARFFGALMNTTLTTSICCKYPTVIRTLGLGWCHCFGNIAVCVAANIVLLSEVYVPLPLILMGLSAFCGSISMCFLPPNGIHDVMDLIEEVEASQEAPQIKKQPQRSSMTGMRVSLMSVFSLDPFDNKQSDHDDYRSSERTDEAYRSGLNATVGKGLIDVAGYQVMDGLTPKSMHQSLQPDQRAYDEPLLLPDMNVRQSLRSGGQPHSIKTARTRPHLKIDEESDDVPYHCTLM